MLSRREKCLSDLLQDVPVQCLLRFRKKLYLCHISAMKHCLNFKVKKACVLVNDVKKLPFNIWPVDLYLHEKIKAPPLYYFGKVKNVVMVRLDHIKYGDF